MKKIMIYTAVLVATASSLENAVASPSQEYIWNGPYAGIEFGGGIGNSSRHFTQSGTTTGNFDVSGILGGVTAGYNWQLQSFVVGLEGDIAGTDIGGNSNCPTVSSTCSDDVQWQATIRPRIGYTFDRFFPYVTGGLTVGSIHQHAYITSTGASDDEATHIEPGWTTGAGVEAVICSHWNAKLEYLHIEYEDVHTPSSIGIETKIPFNENIARIGLNYTFD